VEPSRVGFEASPQRVAGGELVYDELPIKTGWGGEEEAQWRRVTHTTAAEAFDANQTQNNTHRERERERERAWISQKARSGTPQSLVQEGDV
jgi:hypothetical protein